MLHNLLASIVPSSDLLFLLVSILSLYRIPCHLLGASKSPVFIFSLVKREAVLSSSTQFFQKGYPQ